jgi:hypothetical protein
MRGYIQSKTIVGGGLNEHGEPVRGTESWTEKVECTYKPLSRKDNERYSDGQFVLCEYEIIVSDMDFVSKEIQLLDENESLVCAKPVVSIFKLSTVQRQKIVV